MSFQPDSLSDSQLYSLFEELLRRQQSATPRLGTRTFPDLSRDVQARDFSAADLAGLRPYVVSMRQGEWDQSGIFNSTASDVDAIFGEFAEKALADLPQNKVLKLVLYAHGGLVSEQSGLAQAQTHIAWWKQSAVDGIYPLYFVWKTGLGETIAQLLGLAGRASRDLATGPRAWISDPIVAGIARRLGGEAVWSGMKRDAEQAVLPNGTATYVARKLKEFYDRHSGRVELHAVGHSAGAVFHSHFIPMSTVTGNPYFTTTSFLAPAVRVDTFRDLLTMDDGGGGRKLKPEIGKLAIFTMKKDFEKRDNCINIYHQSLLYLIYHAFEPVDPTPILGLEESLRSDPVLLRLLGLTGTPAPNADVIWSPTDQSSGCSATQSTSHGGFSSDAPSLNSILRRILGRCNGEPIHAYPGSRGLGGDGIWDIWAPPLDLPGFSPALTATPPPVPDGSGSTAHGSVSPATPPSSANGKRRALCVGIDAYASPNRLTGPYERCALLGQCLAKRWLPTAIPARRIGDVRQHRQRPTNHGAVQQPG